MKLQTKLQTPDTNFHQCIKPVVNFAHFCGFLPFKGADSQEVSALRFSWFDIQTLKSISAIVGTFCLAILNIFWFLKEPTVIKATRAIFYSSSTVSCVTLLSLGRRWPQFEKVWEDVELATQHLKYKTSTASWCSYLTKTYAILALAEHLLAFSNGMIQATCNKGIDFQKLFIRWFTVVYSLVGFSPMIAIFAFLINLIAAFAVRFLDIFVIVTSYCISERFQLFNSYLKEASNKATLNNDWIMWHGHYKQLCHLVRTVNANISLIIFISFVMNLYQICFQLYIVLNPLPHILTRIYMAFSLGFVTLRMTILIMYCSRIYTETMKPKRVLFSLDSRNYCKEVKAFLFQVCYDKVALTGFGFFFITRKIVIKIVGLCMSYEVLMFQFKTLTDDYEEHKLFAAKSKINVC